jgi:hypothetical protein
METKEELVKHIKSWITLEEELKNLQREIKVRRAEKKKLSEQLIKVMNTNEIDCFNINNGRLIHAKQKSKETITKSFLLKALSTYVDNAAEVEEITKHILDTRETKEKDIIRIKINKT